MNISVIAASHRENSQSKRIAEIIELKLKIFDKLIKTTVIDLASSNLPFWSPEKKKGFGVWGDTWKNISNTLNNSSGFILVVPEYGGMATPQAKNLFLLCDKGELAHKPGLIVAISSGTGGAYPISELRSTSYKNTHIMWIPENIIIRYVEQFLPGKHGNDIPDWIDNRLDYCLKILLAYSENMKPLSKLINRKDFGNGM
jgi:NAD(P)H-dependent FMN reductase